MTLAIPFVAELFPSSPIRHVSLFLAAPFLLSIWQCGISLRNLSGVPPLLWIIIFLSLVHFYGLYMGPTPYWKSVVRDILIVGVVLGVFFSIRYRRDVYRDLLRGFLVAIIPAGLFVAAFGLVKAAMMERGILFKFLYDFDPGHYPPGSCLQRDYNLFSLTLLITGLGIAIWHFQNKRSFRDTVMCSSALALIFTAGIFAGSRRFLLCSISIPIMWTAIGVFVIPKSQVFKKVILPVIGGAITVCLLVWIIQSSVSFQNYKFFYFVDLTDKMPAIIERKNLNGKPITKHSLRTMDVDANEVIIMDASPEIILSTLKQQKAYGFDTRINRWKLAIKLLAEGAWFHGIGFSYHNTFSQRFVDGAFKDYPHFPILSEWLIGGVVGIIAASAVYLIFFQAIWRSGREGLFFGSSAIALSVFPYSLLSGDTIFSIPQFLIVSLLVQSHHFKTKANS